jgi:hypothetical protein
MEEFNHWSNNNNLIHLPTLGAEFTWENIRGGLRHTERKLDRAVCNQSWLDVYHSLSVSTLTKHRSDHYPLLLEFQLSRITFASQFKFIRMWSLHPDCEAIVKNCWTSEVIGCPMFVLSKKLKILKEKLKCWNKESFGNVHDFVTSAETKLQRVQQQNQLNGQTEELLEEEKHAHIVFEEALNKQEYFWKEKANLKLHLEGDRNTNYFHKIAKIKTSSKNHHFLTRW